MFLKGAELQEGLPFDLSVSASEIHLEFDRVDFYQPGGVQFNLHACLEPCK